MVELPEASAQRNIVSKAVKRGQTCTDEALGVTPKDDHHNDLKSPISGPLFIYLSHGLAYTTGSALGCVPPSVETCLEGYQIPNSAGLTAGSRAWSKHSHRSFSTPQTELSSDSIVDTNTDSITENDNALLRKSKKHKAKPDQGWWGRPSGPVKTINESSLALFWRIINNATWRNLHWLPHEILVYEVRIREGYGMRWAQDRSNNTLGKPWIFRGFLEPQMEGGHENGWRHAI